MKTIDDGVVELAKGRYAVRVKRIDARTGKTRNRKATVEGTASDALRRRDEIRGELAGAAAARAPKTLSVYADEWLERRRAWVKPSVSRRYAFALRHILPALGGHELGAIAPPDVELYLADRLRAGAAGNTVVTELRVLRTIARDSVADGYAQRFWCERVRRPKVARYTTEHPNLLAAKQAGRVLGHIPRQWIAFVFFLMTTGLRFGEASALKWTDIEGNVATIRRSNDRGLEVEPKNKSSARSVAVLPEVLSLIRSETRVRGMTYVFPARGGAMHRGSPLRPILERACARAGAPRLTAHGLRRTFNDIARRCGDKQVLQAITGHVTDEMTAHYSLVDDTEKATLAAAVAALIGVPEVSDDRT